MRMMSGELAASVEGDGAGKESVEDLGVLESDSLEERERHMEEGVGELLYDLYAGKLELSSEVSSMAPDSNTSSAMCAALPWRTHPHTPLQTGGWPRSAQLPA